MIQTPQRSVPPQRGYERPRYRNDRGFTLIEIVIVVALLAGIMTVAFGSLHQIMETKRAIEDERDAYEIANSMLTRMTRELQLAIATQPLLPPRDNLKSPMPPRTNLVGERSEQENDRSLDSITFLAQEGGQYVPDGQTHSGTVQISYKAVKAPDEDGRQPQTDLLTLVREEVPYLRPYARAYRQAMIFPLTDRLVSLRFRYYDHNQQEWIDHWGDPEHPGLPSLVSFSFSIRSREGKTLPFSTMVAVERTQ